MDNSIIYKKNSNISENYFTISDSKKKYILMIYHMKF